MENIALIENQTTEKTIEIDENKVQDNISVELPPEDRVFERLNRTEIRHLKLIFRKFLNSRIGGDAAKASTQSDLNAFLKTTTNLVKSHISSLKKEERIQITVDMEFTFIRRLFIDGIVFNENLKELFIENKISNMQQLKDFSKVKYSKLAEMIMNKVNEQKEEERKDVPPIESLTLEDKEFIKNAVSTKE